MPNYELISLDEARAYKAAPADHQHDPEYEGMLYFIETMTDRARQTVGLTPGEAQDVCRSILRDLEPANSMPNLLRQAEEDLHRINGLEDDKQRLNQAIIDLQTERAREGAACRTAVARVKELEAENKNLEAENENRVRRINELRARVMELEILVRTQDRLIDQIRRMTAGRVDDGDVG